MAPEDSQETARNSIFSGLQNLTERQFVFFLYGGFLTAFFRTSGWPKCFSSHPAHTLKVPKSCVLKLPVALPKSAVTWPKRSGHRTTNYWSHVQNYWSHFPNKRAHLSTITVHLPLALAVSAQHRRARETCQHWAFDDYDLMACGIVQT